MTGQRTAMHPRNRHRDRYDFQRLIAVEPALARYVIVNSYGKSSIDFADPMAVRLLNRALLKQDYDIDDWSIPDGFLCPPIPGRADYVHHLADLLAESHGGVLPIGSAIRALDIGTGANVIYPLIGHREYGWHFVGADIDEQALASAKGILLVNPDLAQTIELRHQPSQEHIFHNIIQPNERFDLTLCNPPFHSSLDDAHRGSRRKWKNLGKQDPGRQLPTLNFGGRHHELHCPGGEAAFIARMIDESRAFGEQVFWFSTLVAKGAHLPAILQSLKDHQVAAFQCIDMAQGQKKSRFVAWTFLDKKSRRQWRRQNSPNAASSG